MSRTCESESQPSTVPGPSSSADVEIPAEDVLERLVEALVEAIRRAHGRSFDVVALQRSMRGQIVVPDPVAAGDGVKPSRG